MVVGRYKRGRKKVRGTTKTDLPLGIGEKEEQTLKCNMVFKQIIIIVIDVIKSLL